jgi:hypothetical protein
MSGSATLPSARPSAIRNLALAAAVVLVLLAIGLSLAMSQSSSSTPAPHATVVDTTGAYENGWSTRTGGVHPAFRVNCGPSVPAYVNGFSARTGGTGQC